MRREYDIKTMQKDINALGGSIGSPDSIPEKLPAKKPRRFLRSLGWIVVVIIVFVIIGGTYYWWNYLRVPAFLVGVDKIEVIESLEISVPVDISNVLGKKYTFFLYSQPASPAGRPEGNRAGFVVKISDHEILKVKLRDWENTMDQDLNPMFLGQELGEPVTAEFQDNTYKDIEIRYLNLSDPNLTIDYAIIEDYLIITTSRESMYEVIDVVLGE